MQGELAALNDKLEAFFASGLHDRKKETIYIIIACTGVVLPAMFALIGAIWVVLVNPIVTDMRTVLSEAATSTATRAFTAQEIDELKREVREIRAQMITKDAFSQWIGKANRERQ